MVDYLYVIRMLLQYGFIFLMTYYVVLLSPKIEKYFIRALVSGTILGAELILISFMQEQLGWKELSNGRNFFVVFAMIFWGPIATLPIAIAMMFVSLMHPNIYLLQDLFVFSILFMISYGFRQYRKKPNFIMRWYYILIVTLVPLLITLPLANVLYRNEVAVQQANKSVWIILLTFTVLNYAIFYANFREIDRRKNLKRIKEANIELEGQNLEIRALYEEMAASEETLQANYMELENYKDKLEFLAYHDSKSGLFNHDYLMKQLSEIDEENLKGKIIVYLRIHDFERLVDTIGQTLIEILHTILAKNLSEVLRKFENIQLYQLAQGRFALYIDEEKKVSLEEALTEIFGRLQGIQLIENVYFPVDLDLGAIELETAQEDVSLWLEWAEIAMIESSKTLEKNRLIWFSREMHDKKQYQNRLEFDIQQAIVREELYIVLQPQYTKSHDIIGAEVLLRWKHKEFGLISPQIFIPLAEKLGLINSIGRYVLSEAIKVIQSMREHSGKEVPISINTSMLELLDINFSKHLLRIVTEERIPSEKLNIEITESAIVENLQSVRNNIQEMHAAGVRIHLDDFGTGYSSLSHLGSLPVSYVKIDKSFVDEILLNERSLQIVRTIIELVHRLDMQVIAEGVEKQEQLECLDQLGCDYYQGFYFSRPVAKEVFFGLLE